MHWGNSFTRWAAAVIVMIAALVLSPDVAIAHPGHSDASSVTVSVSAQETALKSNSQLDERAQSTPADAPAQSTNVPAADDRDPQAPCSDSCCLMAGASCCGAAFVGGPAGLAEQVFDRLRLAPHQDSLPSGLSAQALQEPPRVQI
jgi:hypothetical protein